jgi:ribosomal protein L22
MESGYTSLTVDQLSKELERRGLPTSGGQEELVARLLEDDGASGAAARDAPPEDEAAPPEDEAPPPEQDEPREEVAPSEEEVPAGSTAEPSGDDDGDAAEETPPAGRRRGAAETVARREPEGEDAVVRLPRDRDGLVAVRAHARYVRTAPRKARLVMDHIRGKRVDEARALLRHTPRRAASDISKLLESAVANAENNFELDPDDLAIRRAFVDEGPTIKRYRPRAQGRATPIHKRTSHMTITLTTRDGS